MPASYILPVVAAPLTLFELAGLELAWLLRQHFPHCTGSSEVGREANPFKHNLLRRVGGYQYSKAM